MNYIDNEIEGADDKDNNDDDNDTDGNDGDYVNDVDILGNDTVTTTEKSP